MLSRYKIFGQIGSGGIGVVHRAEDQSLQREVALKFLSEESLAKPQVRARFLREARLAASLNHPGICTIHEVGEADEERTLVGGRVIREGTPYIAMELIDGQPLDRILDSEERLPIERVLDIALQVARGLVAAHAKSIVHRDLKPRNIMVLPGGRVKILDFGLAKPLSPAAGGDVTMTIESDESISRELTREGMVVGTVAYMSPEQAQGHPVDSRSDVFAFGVVLYEMAAGAKPFKGDSATSTLAKILEAEPRPIEEIRPDLPLEFLRIVLRCLRKDPADRYNDTRDLAVALKDLRHDTSSGAIRKAVPEALPGAAPSPRARPGRRIFSWVALAVLLAVVATATWILLPRGRGPVRVVPPTFRQVTYTGSASYPAISRDGQYIAYVTDRRPSGQAVMVQDLAGGQPLDVFEADWVRSVRWSPNGSELLVSGGLTGDVARTFLVPRLGGGTRPLSYFQFVAWSPDAERFAGASLQGKQIQLVDTATGQATSVGLDGTFAWLYDLDWSPNGALLVFLTGDEQKRHAIRTLTVDGHRQQTVVEHEGSLHAPRFSTSGNAIYYLVGRGQTSELWKAPIHPQRGQARGEPVLLLPGLHAGDQLAVGGDGKRLLYNREMSQSNLWLLERSGGGTEPRTTRLTAETLRNVTPRFSPDGSRIAFARETGATTNIFVMDVASRGSQQLTFLGADSWQPVWSPDGEEIAFGSTQGGEPKIWTIGTSGGMVRQIETTHLGRDLVWAPGPKILYQRQGNSSLHFVDPGTGEGAAFVDEAAVSAMADDPLQFFAWMSAPVYSPDGQQVAFNCNCPGGAGIWLGGVDGSSLRLLLEGEHARPVRWSADGTSIYALQPGTRSIASIPARGGSPETLLNLPFENVGGIDVTPDGQRIVCAVPERQADVWLVENFDPASD